MPTSSREDFINGLVNDNATIWDTGDPTPGSPNTRATHMSDYIKLNLSGGGSPTYEGNLTYEISDGLGGTGSGTIGVENFATSNVGGYRTLTGTNGDDVLLGLDGRNNIDGGGGNDIIHGGHDNSGDILSGGAGSDVIFGGSGNDELYGNDGDDTFIMQAGFGRDDVDGGVGDSDTISLDSVLTGADVADSTAINAWLTLNGDATYIHDAANDTITLSADASGTIDLGGGNEITFANIEQIDYALVG